MSFCQVVLIPIEINVVKKNYVHCDRICKYRVKYYEEQLHLCKIDKHNEEQLHCCKIDKNNEEQLDCCRICKYKYLQPIIFQNSRDSFAGGSVSLDVRTSSKHLSLLVAAC